MGKIIFLNRYYAPDHSATSQLLTDLAEYLTNEGLDIHIVSSRQLYENPDANLISNELLNKVRVHRVYSTKFGRGNLMGRSFDYFTFYISAFIYLIINVKKTDTVVAKTDPPLISVIAGIVAKLKGAKLVNWLQDLFPEVVNELSPNTIPKPIYNLLVKLRNWSLKVAYKNIVIGELMKSKLCQEGVSSSEISVIHNWYIGDTDLNTDEVEILREQWGLKNKYVIGYSGNMGRAHDYESIVKLIKQFRNFSNIKFLFIGGGIGMEKLMQIVLHHDLQNVVFKKYQPRSQLNKTLSIIDLHIVTLKNTLEGLIVPSKTYGIMAMKRSILFIGDLNGEVSRLIADNKCGISISSDEDSNFTDIVMRYIEDRYAKPTSFRSYATKSYIEKHTIKSNADKWLDVFV